MVSNNINYPSKKRFKHTSQWKKKNLPLFQQNKKKIIKKNYRKALNRRKRSRIPKYLRGVKNIALLTPKQIRDRKRRYKRKMKKRKFRLAGTQFL